MNILLENHIKKFVLLPCMLLLPGLATHAADKDFCSDYVLVAISQFWQSVDENCSFTGPRWSANYKGQFDWCLTAHQWVAENETETRAELLEECRVAAKSKEKQHDDVAINDQTVAGTTNKRDNNLNRQLLSAVADNDLKEVQKLVSKGADIHFETDDPVLIKTLGMSSHLGTGITIHDTDVNVSSVDDASINDKVSLRNEPSLARDSGATPAESSIPANGSIEIVGNRINGKIQDAQLKSESILSYAVSKGLVDIGLWLLEQDKENLNVQQSKKIRDDLLGRALIGAVKEKNHQRVNALLDKGALVDYDLEQNFGTPLYFAVTNGATAIAEKLLSKGASPKYSTNAGKNLLCYALDKPKLLKLLLDHGADPNANGESPNFTDYPIIQAVKNGNAEIVELLMLRGANADIYDYETTYPLLQAVADQQANIVEVLLKNGANPNVVYNPDSPSVCVEGSQNVVPLSKALSMGNDDIVKLLRKSGAKRVEEICKK